MVLRTSMLPCRQILYDRMPMPFKPPQIMKFHEAPCHKPPNSMVFIMLRLVLIFNRAFLLTNEATSSASAMPPMMQVITTLLVSRMMTAAMSEMQR